MCICACVCAGVCTCILKISILIYCSSPYSLEIRFSIELGAKLVASRSQPPVSALTAVGFVGMCIAMPHIIYLGFLSY